MKTSPKIKEAASLPPATPGAEKAAVNFMEVVYRIVRRIPKGRATSYGAIAEASGIRLTARMVGWAMNAAGRAQPPVPAHRVVNSKGELSGRGHFATPSLMQELLEQEGIQVKNDKIEDWKRVFWDPAEENKAALKPKTAARPAAAARTTEKSRSVSATASRAKPAPKPKSSDKPSNASKAVAKPAATKTRTTEKSRSVPATASRNKAKPAPKPKSSDKPSNAPKAVAKPAATKNRTTEKSRSVPATASRNKAKPAPKPKSAAKPATPKTPGRPPGPKIKKEK